ncbi:hypothetical protein DMC63_23265 [Streptomyces sp. WAC 05977]|nr:hypothetical protein DMC63_23265 [Streptomyces sp. WAC 05977]
MALKLGIDSRPWAGVPVFLRAGKCLPDSATEVRPFLRHTPRLRFLPDAAQVEANQIVLRVSPTPALRLSLSGLDNRGRWLPIRLDTTFERDLGSPRSPYERLLADALDGDDRLFTWQDAVDESWRILQPPSPTRRRRGHTRSARGARPRRTRWSRAIPPGSRRGCQAPESAERHR